MSGYKDSSCTNTGAEAEGTQLTIWPTSCSSSELEREAGRQPSPHAVTRQLPTWTAAAGGTSLCALAVYHRATAQGDEWLQLSMETEERGTRDVIFPGHGKPAPIQGLLAWATFGWPSPEEAGRGPLARFFLPHRRPSSRLTGRLRPHVRFCTAQLEFPPMAPLFAILFTLRIVVITITTIFNLQRTVSRAYGNVSDPPFTFGPTHYSEFCDLRSCFWICEHKDIAEEN